jgi:hypothetical protein
MPIRSLPGPARASTVYRVRVRWVLATAIALLFMGADESYRSVWPSPFFWVESVLYEATPWKIRPFDHIVAVCLILALRSPDGKGPRVGPMRNALRLAAATIAIWFFYGVVVRGGAAYEASFQTYLLMSGILLAFAIAAAFRTPEHYAMLAKAILLAAAYRALMCWAFYIFHVNALPPKLKPEFMTSHDDTVLWVVSMLVLLLRAIWTPQLVARAKALSFLLFLVGALLFNQRRLAWVSLTMGLVLMFILIPPGKYKRRVSRALLALSPVIAIYVAVGWGRKEQIFKPLGSFATVSTQEDASTKARNMENLGIIRTYNYNSLLMGTGWGHPYIEVTHKYSIASIYKMWAYFPHNSILAMLGYTGVLGFFGYWLALPTAVFLNARTARFAPDLLARQAGIIGASQLVVCANQYFGDMGVQFPKAVYMLSVSYALALRLPILVGAWPARTRALRAGEGATRPAKDPA